MTEDFLRDRIRFLRNERGMSAREMSLNLGQNEAYINKIETGQRSLPMDMFFNLCDFLHITPAQFFSEDFNNTELSNDEILSCFRKLSTKQSKLIVELMKDLAQSSDL